MPTLFDQDQTTPTNHSLQPPPGFEDYYASVGEVSLQTLKEEINQAGQAAAALYRFLQTEESFLILNDIIEASLLIEKVQE